jgi:hypothetical protein
MSGFESKAHRATHGLHIEQPMDFTSTAPVLHITSPCTSHRTPLQQRVIVPHQFTFPTLQQQHSTTPDKSYFRIPTLAQVLSFSSAVLWDEIIKTLPLNCQSKLQKQQHFSCSILNNESSPPASIKLSFSPPLLLVHASTDILSPGDKFTHKLPETQTIPATGAGIHSGQSLRLLSAISQAQQPLSLAGYIHRRVP